MDTARVRRLTPGLGGADARLAGRPVASRGGGLRRPAGVVSARLALDDSNENGASAHFHVDAGSLLQRDAVPDRAPDWRRGAGALQPEERARRSTRSGSPVAVSCERVDRR